MPEPIPRRVPLSAFAWFFLSVIGLPQEMIWIGFPASFREHDFSRARFRGCSYFVMFRPHSLLASQVAPTAASYRAGRPRLLRPSRTCVVTFARIGYAFRPTTGNWRNEDFHLARFTVLSAAHISPLPSFLLESLPTAGPLCSTAITAASSLLRARPPPSRLPSFSRCRRL
jgi:hypothetical protein